LLSSQQSNLKSTSKSGRSRKKPPLPPSTFPIEHYLQPVLSSTSKGPILTIHLFSSSGVWSWLPSINLPISRSSHPLDAACTSSSLSRIIALCSGNPRDNSSFVLQAHRKLTVEEMRDLISHDSPVNQQILNLYLHLLSNQYDATFLDTGFFSLLKDHGWSRVSSWFALQAPQFCARSNSCPLLTTESVISIHSLPRLQQPLGCCHKEGDLWFSVLPLCQ
jgi:hypothetical protein